MKRQTVHDLEAAFRNCIELARNARRSIEASTLTAAAAALGVTREHLSRVIHGHRQSRSLLRRYAALSDTPRPVSRKTA